MLQPVDSSSSMAAGTVPAVTAPEVSVVIPIYNEAENLRDLVARVHEALAPRPGGFELICVDDGSRDGSDKLLVELAAERPWLKPVILARNYGQSTALQAGFERALGRYVATLDGDLQNDPLDLPALLDRLETDDSIDMISGWREHRQDRAISRRLPSRLANRLISWATKVELHDYGCALKVYRREIIERIHLYGELHRFIPSLAKEAGARIAEVPVRHHARTRGVSKYGIDRTFRVILDLLLIVFVLRYRQRPLHVFGGLGLSLATPGVLILAYLMALKILGEEIGHRPLLMAGTMLVLVGLQFIVAGLISEMLVRIYHEGGARPQYHVRSARMPADGSR
ncbi:glycosyltransferase involved in cell wall biosynthesis [Rubrivivax gelatinosus]|nr:glycosyltransferase family 2 protein [Rubrivivax gelatinosus]MBG6079754.1 glycosyltransferase involved in cell wall biosynthesis [Rubrivivax gelatinosus]